MLPPCLPNTLDTIDLVLPVTMSYSVMSVPPMSARKSLARSLPRVIGRSSNADSFAGYSCAGTRIRCCSVRRDVSHNQGRAPFLRVRPGWSSGGKAEGGGDARHSADQGGSDSGRAFKEWTLISKTSIILRSDYHQRDGSHAGLKAYNLRRVDDAY